MGWWSPANQQTPEQPGQGLRLHYSRSATGLGSCTHAPCLLSLSFNSGLSYLGKPLALVTSLQSAPARAGASMSYLNALNEAPQNTPACSSARVVQARNASQPSSLARQGFAAIFILHMRCKINRLLNKQKLGVTSPSQYSSSCLTASSCQAGLLLLNMIFLPFCSEQL